MERLAIVLLVAFTGCVTSGGDNPARCQPASESIVSKIEAGLNVSSGGSLSDAFTVKSHDFDNVYFVAARIAGEGTEDPVGVWALNSLSDDASIASADEIAGEFSDWAANPAFTPSDDGLSVAHDCAAG
jgi:hypothetical protein